MGQWKDEEPGKTLCTLNAMKLGDDMLECRCQLAGKARTCIGCTGLFSSSKHLGCTSHLNSWEGRKEKPTLEKAVQGRIIASEKDSSISFMSEGISNDLVAQSLQ